MWQATSSGLQTRRRAAYGWTAIAAGTLSLLVWLAARSVGAIGLSPPVPQNSSQPADTPPPPADVERLYTRLGDADWRTREQATRDIIALGHEAMDWLRSRAADETDPEIRHRVRFILENIASPERAVLVTRTTPNSAIEPGDLITHINDRRIESTDELARILRDLPNAAVARVRGRDGPREVGAVLIEQIVSRCDYREPRGPTLARVVRLYADGYAEQAYDLLQSIAEPIPESEFDPLLRARIAYTAGHRADALDLIGGRVDVARPEGGQNIWSGPSLLDFAGPGRAPLHLEWVLFNAGGPSMFERSADPDIRVQRLLVPAHRYVDAMREAANLWWTRFRGRLDDNRDNIAAGNMLAVVAWMFWELDLQSECCRLIEPRSAILTYTWIRVQTDAWLPFLAGDSKRAVDRFYDDARYVLQQQGIAFDRSAVTRNPHVAAAIAFFLYQVPDDPRRRELLDIIRQPGQPALTSYADWMLQALMERNFDAIRDDFGTILPLLSDQQAPPFAQAVALLEYASGQPQDTVIAAARQRIAQAADSPERTRWLAIVDALAHLAADRPGEALAALDALGHEPLCDPLRQTARFLADPPPTAAQHEGLKRPLLVVPLGASDNLWLVLGRDRRLMQFDAQASVLAPLAAPSSSWFPSPLTFPWVGRQDSTGRVWVYDRRRVVEITPQQERPLRLNIRAADIAAFHRHVGPLFSVLADLVADVPVSPGENSEFLRAEIRANAEFVADPDLPEIGLIETQPADPRLVHVALRGGPQLLIDTHTGRHWSSQWVAQQAGLSPPPTWFVRAVRGDGDSPPRAVLLTDQGVLHLDTADETLTRLDLPGTEPHPAVIPESVPYQRRDPRFVYCARPPRDGGQVFRIVLDDLSVQQVDMINETLPPEFYAIQSRATIRAALDRELAELSIPSLEEFIADAMRVIAEWRPRESP